ncbi:MAG TPA: hypothetical protein VMR34_05775 [Candidatus Saccharimonadales bacterium]|nr:hypothetical protein [Candidatus Saccharimonadales bacterium]
MDNQKQNPEIQPTQNLQNVSSPQDPSTSDFAQGPHLKQPTSQDSSSTKGKFGLALNIKWPPRLAVSAVAISLVFAGLIIYGHVLNLVPENCNSVKTVCSNYNSLVAHLILTATALLVSVIVIRLLVSKKWLPTLLIVLPAASLVGFSFESFTLNYMPSYFANTNSSVIGYLGYALTALVPLLVGFFIGTVIFSWTSKKALWITVALCLILTGAAYFINPGYESSTITSESSSNKQAISEQNSINLENLEKLPLTLYKPSLASQGYKFDGERELGNSFTGNQDASQADYLEIQYSTTNTQTLTPGGYNFYEFATPNYYNPPTDCGDNMPAIAGIGHITTPCQLIGHSSTGCNVYFSAPTYTTGTNAYCQIKSTLVVISYETDQPNTGGQIPEATISNTLQMFNSLQQASAKQIASLENQ